MTLVSDRFIPLSDPRRSSRGNRTVRVLLAAWEELQSAIRKRKSWTDANSTLRGICRVSAYHLPPSDPYYGNDERISCHKSIQTLLEYLIHGSYPVGSPSEKRKRYAKVIRIMLQQLRDRREFRRLRLQPGQSTCKVP